jgi:response regulator NasT
MTTMETRFETAPRPLPQAPLALLVVDDDHTTGAALAAQLTGLGHRVVGMVSSAEDAVDRCRSGGVDLVVTSARVRTTDGGSLWRRLEEDVCLPVLACVAPGSIEDDSAKDVAAAFGLLVGVPSPARLQAALARAWMRHRHLVDQAEEIGRLTQRLEDRRVIERAKWMLVESFGVSEPEALRRLQRTARNRRRPLRDIASSLIDSAPLLPDQPDPRPPSTSSS